MKFSQEAALWIQEIPTSPPQLDMPGHLSRTWAFYPLGTLPLHSSYSLWASQGAMIMFEIWKKNVLDANYEKKIIKSK